jgi:hypothetical protein
MRKNGMPPYANEHSLCTIFYYGMLAITKLRRSNDTTTTVSTRRSMNIDTMPSVQRVKDEPSLCQGAMEKNEIDTDCDYGFFVYLEDTFSVDAPFHFREDLLGNSAAILEIIWEQKDPPRFHLLQFIGKLTNIEFCPRK